MTRVGHVAVVNFCPNGGMSHYAQNLVEALASGRRVTLVTAPEDPALGYGLCEEYTYSCPPRRHALSRFAQSAYFWQFGHEACAHLRPAVIHFVSEGFGLVPFMIAAARHGIPTVYTLHDPVRHAESRTWVGHIVTKLDDWTMPQTVFRLASAIHTHTAQHSAYVADRIPATSGTLVYVAPHGVGVAASIRQPGKGTISSASTRRGPLRVLLFGRIEAYKGATTLIDAVDLISRKHPILLTIAGAGQVEPSVARRLSQLQPKPMVINRFVGDGEIAELFASSDVVAIPYDEATQSGVAALALAFGVPVIATRVGGLPELVIPGTTGLLVPPKNAAAFADALAQLSEPDVLNRLRVATAAQVTHHLGWDRAATLHVEHYERLVHGAAQRRAVVAARLPVTRS
jgi:glycosyltransferase involved in cell wall biosynthesis